MLEKDEFEIWIEAFHAMFKIFEGRYDAYPLAIKWVGEWLTFQQFTVSKEDKKIVDEVITNFNYDAYRNPKDPNERNINEWNALIKKADQQFRLFSVKNLNPNKHENVGFAIAPFLFTWNFQRFKEYFKKREDFNLEQYFKSIGEFLKDERKKLQNFRNKRLVSDQIEKENVTEIFERINDKLKEIGIGHNEPISTIKILHSFAPHYFPLLDNPIAKAIRLASMRRSLNIEDYLSWMNRLRRWLFNYSDKIGKLEDRLNSSILKLVDEGLYMMSTVNLQARVSRLGI